MGAAILPTRPGVTLWRKGDELSLGEHLKRAPKQAFALAPVRRGEGKGPWPGRSSSAGPSSRAAGGSGPRFEDLRGPRREGLSQLLRQRLRQLGPPVKGGGRVLVNGDPPAAVAL